MFCVTRGGSHLTAKEWVELLSSCKLRTFSGNVVRDTVTFSLSVL
jgi:hypothetical protein